MIFDTPEEAVNFLEASNIFYYGNEEDEIREIESEGWSAEDKEFFIKEVKECKHVVNFNDTWSWAMPYGEKVEDNELMQVAELFWRYGWGGLLYWCSVKNKNMRSEFYDVNRVIDFVTKEEEIKIQCRTSSELAYKKVEYNLGN